MNSSNHLYHIADSINCMVDDLGEDWLECVPVLCTHLGYQYDITDVHVRDGVRGCCSKCFNDALDINNIYSIQPFAPSCRDLCKRGEHG